MPLKGDLISHLTCLVYVPYLWKFKTFKIINLAKNEHFLR